MLLPICLFLQIWHVYSGEKLKGLTRTLKTDNFLDPYKIDISALRISYFSNNLRDKKIFGGSKAATNSFPFQAALVITLQDNKTGFCGGSIISPNFILTAAHCLLNKPRTILVVLGATDLSKKEDGKLMMHASYYTYHAQFVASSFNNDIGVVNLPVSIKYNDVIKPLKLPSSGDAKTRFKDAEVTVLGWGKVRDDGERVSQLRYLKTRVIPNSKCNPCGAGVRKTNICTSGSGGTGACNGDSGSPLIYNNMQIGIVSFGCALCSAGDPTVYTLVTSYLDWIASNTDAIDHA